MPITDDLGNNLETPIPAWFLAPHEEKEIRKRCQDRTTEECKAQFIKFGECAKDHQILFSWKCADLKKELFDCVSLWGSHSKYDELREEFIIEKKKQLVAEAKPHS